MSNNTMSRKQFLQKTALGVAALAVASKVGGLIVPYNSDVKSEETVQSQHVGLLPPSDTNMTWLDSSCGILKYWNGVAWVPTKSAWG